MDCYAQTAVEADLGHKNHFRRQLIAQPAFNSGVGYSVVPLSIELRQRGNNEAAPQKINFYSDAGAGNETTRDGASGESSGAHHRNLVRHLRCIFRGLLAADVQRRQDCDKSIARSGHDYLQAWSQFPAV